MAKQLNVSLNFSANTEQAKKQLQALQTSLTSLVNNTKLTKDMDLTQALKVNDAISATAELKAHLQAATNVQTGNLDFSKLSDSLKKSGKSLTEYGQQLKELGPEGQRAFQSLANSVVNAEMPLRRSNALLNEMWVSLKNTARWQISSSILHGFMGTMQSAYGYAQDLNKSLNNIRIVTGYSTDEMSQFAKEANKAAKALSTTTTEYTDASLIFYQQGLNAEEVKERTEVTIKMANAAGQSAEVVSDQLTAVWNNFYDGTKSLEYYADVMTALGAATASSTDEISGGLEKFAAIGDTIGLSFEYAASALATITSNTRQSEEVVGTALKTIFARIQGLKLGETLEDGTELNKYSEALAKVGISIFDSSGEMKKMDNILTEMAAKWDTLSNAQQTALAQTVAGVRQYTQLVALMENWDNGDNDSMMANLDTSYNATGALQEQADIYAESWEAARDRVQAAAQGIFDNLLEDEVFIDLLNSLEKILTFIDQMIDSVGGLGGVLTVLGTILTKVFRQQLASTLEDAAYSIKMLSAAGRESLKKEKNDFIHDAATSTNPEFDTREEKAQSKVLEENLQLQSQLMDGAERMTQIELETNKVLIERARIQGESYVKAAKDLQDKENLVGDLSFQGRTQVIAKAQADGKDVGEQTQKYIDKKEQLNTGIKLKTNLPDELRKMSKEGKSSAEILKKLQTEATKLGDKELNKLIAGLKESNVQGDDLEQTLARVVATIDGANDVKIGEISDLGVKEETLDGLVDGFTEVTESEKIFNQEADNVTKANQSAEQSMQKSKGATLSWSDHMVNAANTAMGLASAIQAVGGIIDTIKNPDMTGWEKFSSILMSITTIIPMLAMAFTKESIASLAAMSAAIAHAFGLETEATAAMGAAAATGTFAGSLWTLLWPIGLVMLAIAALVAVIAVLVHHFKELEAASPAGQLEAAEKNASAAAKALEEANTAAKNLKDTIDNYDSAVEKLKTVSTNTDEFTQALEEANAEARTLIETYDLLAGKDYNFNASTGLIEFEDGVLEGLEEKFNDIVKNAEINHLAAKNEVLAAENLVAFDKMATEDDILAIFRKLPLGDLFASVLKWHFPVLGDQEEVSKEQAEALERLNELYVLNNNNYITAYKALSEADKELIEALGCTDAELQELVATTSANTKAILEQNKQIIDMKFKDNAIYNANPNKEYLNEILADDLQTEKEKILNEYKQYSSGWESTNNTDSNMNTDKVKKYAEEVLGLTNYGISEFKGTTMADGSAELTTEDGQTLTLSANQIMSYAAEQEALENLNNSMGDYSRAANKLRLEEAELTKQFEEGTITYDQYKAALLEAMDAEIKEGTITEDQINSYINKHGTNQKGASANAVKENLIANGVINEGVEKFEQEFIKAYGNYTPEQLQLAVNVSSDATSLQGFLWDFERAVGQATIDGLKKSQDEVNTILASGIANGIFSQANIDQLADNSDFMAYLEEKNIALEDFTNQAYDKQVQILTEYRGYLQTLREEAIETQKVIVASQMAVTAQEAFDAQDIVADEKLDSDEKKGMTDEQIKLYERAIELRKEYAAAEATLLNPESTEAQVKKAKETIAELEKTWEEEIGDGLPLSIDDSDLGAAWDKIIALEEELLNLDSIDVKLEFADDMVKSLEDMIEAQSTFEKAVRDDMKKVNNSYQMTIDTARKWRDVYPDLFKQATVTGDGLIAINANVVNAQLAGSDAIRAAAAKQAIAQINNDIEELKSKRKTVEASLKLAQSMKDGEYNLEKMSVEELALLRRAQTDYYMELGYEEEVATEMALKSMGISQQEYAQLVANAAVKSANKTIEANEGIATRVQLVIENLKALWQGLLTGLKSGWDALVKWITGEGDISAIGSAISGSWNQAMNTINRNRQTYKNTVDANLGFKGDEIVVGGEKYEITAEMKLGAHKNFEEALKGQLTDIDNTIAELEWNKIELEALYKMSAEDWGEDLDDYDDDKDKKSKKDKKDALELAERYHELTREVTALEHALDKAGKAKDRAFGAKKLQAIDKEIKAMEDLFQTQEDLYRAQLVYLALDKQKVSSAFGAAEFNEKGEIVNYSDLASVEAEKLNNARTKYNNSAQTDADKDALEAAEKRYENQIKILEQYEETLDATRESELALEEAYDNWQAANFEKFSYKLDLQIDLKDDDLKSLDYYLAKTEDDFYQRVEGLAILSQQTDVYTQSLHNQSIAWGELNALKDQNKISDAQYIEGMDTIIDVTYEDLEALQALDKQMMEYYGETLRMASEEIDKVTDQMEHHNSVLEHYLSILELMGEQANYKTIGVVLEGQAEVKKDRMIASQKEWQMFQEETDAKYLAWKNATDEASAEMLKKQYEDALAISSEKQDEYLSMAEEYAQSLKSILENSLLEYAQDLENALTGGISFDQMNTKLERAAAIQEEYLTTTNKIYETNKMMNTAQQEIDKTTNSVAKQKLKQFIDETNQLQKKNKLSQYELDIQQAKYDLLLAEIALEEAQNAKSSVRLQRDSEGNFGYVYTADQDKIAEAQQKLADAQNSLYNISLEGQNDYFTKYQETMSEMYDYFTELHQQYLDGEFESEQEYQNAVAEAKQYYYEMLEQYSDLYTIAVSADARALEDAWSSEFNSMVYNTKNWQTQVDTYIGKAAASFKRYEREMDTLSGELGISGDLNEISSSVEGIVDQNEALLQSLLSPGGVFDTLEAEIALVNDVAAAYATERASVLELIKTYEALTLAIVNAKRAEAGKDPLDSLKLPTNNAEQDTAVNGSAEPNGGDGTPKVGDKVRYNSGKYYYRSDGSSPTGQKYQGSEVYITDINTRSWATHPYHISTGNRLHSGDLGWLKLNQISGYDTGGYTGRWGSYGKLAMLHEKEIVLNKQDTANFLQSMELLNNIVQTIDLYSANQQISGVLNSPSFGKLKSDILEQKVEIEAHFPNVSSRAEIEEAFATLVNRASQYVNRN